MSLPIINSLLQTDWYKISMANMIYERGHANTHVKYEFKNRTKDIDLKDWINVEDLEKQIDYVKSYKFDDNDLKWILNQGPFSFDFITKLRNIKLPTPTILTSDGKFDGITIEGEWFHAIWWEIYLLAIINQLFNQSYMKEHGTGLLDEQMMLKGVSKLEEKIGLLKQYPDIKFSEFGTRRRFSGKWQEYVIKRLAQEIPNQLVGTSNVFFAKKFGLKPVGTQAHELYMAYASIYGDVVKAQQQLLDDWWSVYGGPGSIALIDTWGTDFFFRNFSIKHMVNFWGVRQDSGDPFVIGNKIIDYYKQAGIDSLGKMILFSDGLNIEKVIELYKYFKDRISIAFGIGTNLTNDLGGQPLSIVIKLMEANGEKTCKLSDNINKSMGDPDVIEQYKVMTGYNNNFREQPVY